MFESDGYINTANTSFRRVFYLPEPLVTMKVRLDEIDSSQVLVLRIDFLGMDRETKHELQHPFKGGKVLGSKFLKKKFT